MSWKRLLPLIPLLIMSPVLGQDADRLRMFEQEDSLRPVKPGGTLFLGSSSIQLWDLEQSFPGLHALNRGISGSEIADALRDADRIVIPYRPRMIVFYAGENDIFRGKSPENVAADFQTFVHKVRGELPRTQILFLAIKPSPSRWDQVGPMREANRLIAEFAEATHGVQFLDVHTPLLGANGAPVPEYFVEDNLHLSPAGYRVWTSLVAPLIESEPVTVSEDDLVIPTYVAGPPEPSPLFFFGRNSQGAEGRIYPYPLYDKLTWKKEDKSYRIVYLENEFIRIGVLPEIGGRIFEGLDKTNGYHFFYRQHVIKPALIGLIGAWISGGVEWNIPHHHRATTFLPVQYRIEEEEDGSKTVWVGELEIRHRTRWAVGYRLRPGKSYLEARLRIANRTPLENTMLCFANVAVHATEDYQVIFPPSTQYVTHHHKREFTTWPIATTRYGGSDFSEGVDVSWYKNHYGANSMFAWNYDDDFMAGYDHGVQAGVMSVADHHMVPGKKLWTWGNAPRGRMWDDILTDDDGPYIELMVGAYSDNQPDYSWLDPFETRSFSIFWYPFREIGGVKEANLDAAVNLETADGRAKVGLYTTAKHRARASVAAGDRVLLEREIQIGPARPFVTEVPIPEGVDETSLRVTLSSGERVLLDYSPKSYPAEEMPEPYQPPPAPEEIDGNEELYLTGLRIDQFHDPNLDAEPYWQEALRRDPDDVRVNTALGISYLKKARYSDAEELLRRALKRVTAQYTLPRDADPLYYLGLALKAQGKLDEAFDTFQKATWRQPWKAAAYYSAAEIATARSDFSQALELLDRSLEANTLNLRALTLRAAVLRHLGRASEASQSLSRASTLVDPLDVRIMTERRLLDPADRVGDELFRTLVEHEHTALETAAEYLNAGLWQDGFDLLSEFVERQPSGTSRSPLTHYYLGYFAEQLDRKDVARRHFRLGSQGSTEWVFPFQAELIPVLTRALDVFPEDSRAAYYLGNLLFDHQPDAAVAWWKRAVDGDPDFAMAHRNIGIAYAHGFAGGRLQAAARQLEQAVETSQDYPLHFYELDQVYEALGRPPAERLARLESSRATVEKGVQSLSRMISLKVFVGEIDEAIELISTHRFDVWEGGTNTAADDWTDAHILRGRRHLRTGDAAAALDDFRKAGRHPDNVPSEARGSELRKAEVLYWTGVAMDSPGQADAAREAWEEAAESVPLRGRRPPDSITARHVQDYYRALSLRRLGRSDEAEAILRALAEAAAASPADFGDVEFDTVDEATRARSRASLTHYVAALGRLGVGDEGQARAEAERALEISPDHLGAKALLEAMSTASLPARER